MFNNKNASLNTYYEIIFLKCISHINTALNKILFTNTVKLKLQGNKKVFP